MNSKWGSAWGIVLLLVVTLLTPVYPAAAQSPDTYVVSFADLGYLDEVIYGPQGSTSFYFSLPANWGITEGSYLTFDLEYQALFPGESGSPPALVTVQFNGQTVHTEELLFPSTRTVTIDLPADLFRLSESRYLNTLQVAFDEYSPCELSTYTSLRIKSTSALHFAYADRPLQLDLTFLPKPMYQSRSFQPQGVRIVLPCESGRRTGRRYFFVLWTWRCISKLSTSLPIWRPRRSSTRKSHRAPSSSAR